MPKFNVTIAVHATDIMQAQIARDGVQNVLDELAEHQAILIDLSDPRVAKKYKNQIMGVLDNPAIKMLAKTLKFK